MKRYLILIMLAMVVLIGIPAGCGGALQTFNKYGISFKVSQDLKLEEFTVRIKDQVFRKGTASYEEGAVIGTGKNFMLFWLRTVPQFTSEEIRLSVVTTANIFESADGTFQAKITGDLSTQRIGSFDVVFAKMQFTRPGWEAPGITAVWYSTISQRTMQLVIIHKQPTKEMERFIRSFTDSGTPITPTHPSPSGELKSYLEKATPIGKRHAETTDTTNQANRAFVQAVASGNEAEIIKRLTKYKDTLSWALSRVDSELADFKKLSPPPEARGFHSLAIDALVKEQDGLANLLAYNSAVLRYGRGDSAALNRGNSQLAEGLRLWTQARYELADLQRKFQRK